MPPDPFNPFETPESTPLRRDWVRRRRLDANGQIIDELVVEKIIRVSPEGSIDQEQVMVDRYYDCGHTADMPPGGRCAEPGCFRTTCQQCFTRCAACNVPLCQRHAMRCDQEGRAFVLCRECRDTGRRREFWRGLRRALLSPFVTFPEQKD